MPRPQHSATDRPRPEISANPLPFAPIPHELVADPRLTPGDRDLVAWLLGQAWSAPYVQVANKDIMNGLEIGRRTVQDRLKRCKEAGWLACEEDVHHRSGRRIVFIWRCENGRSPHANDSAHPMRDAAHPMRVPAHPRADSRTPQCGTPHTPVRISASPSYEKGIGENQEQQQRQGVVDADSWDPDTPDWWEPKQPDLVGIEQVTGWVAEVFAVPLLFLEDLRSIGERKP